MKTFIISAVFAIIISSSFVACNNSSDPSKMQDVKETQQFSLDTTKLKAGEVFYQCEMHPEVTSDKPGSCPKCGMNLDKMEKK